MIRRRDLLLELGGAVLLSRRAFAQGQRIRRIGVLVGNASSATDPSAQLVLRPFQEALRDAGWIEGKNIHIEYRFGGGDLAQIQAAASELVALAPDVIYVVTFRALEAVHERTKTISIVFSQVVDPIGPGFVASLAHPGGNVTGFISHEFSLGGKWVQLLREIAPEVNRIGIIYNPDTTPYAESFTSEAERAGGHEVTLVRCAVHDDNEIENAASTMGHDSHGGFLILPEPFTIEHASTIIAEAVRFRVPAVDGGGLATRGGLISYSFAIDAHMRQPAAYIDRILKGESPSDLPVQTPTRYELIINLKTAKALSLTIPPTLLVRADEVIE
jgi:putative ABC transport system substrate-binding protein